MRYRIVCGWRKGAYDVQWRWWWFPIWSSWSEHTMEGSGFDSVEKAEEWLADYNEKKARCGVVVKKL